MHGMGSCEDKTARSGWCGCRHRQRMVAWLDRISHIWYASCELHNHVGPAPFPGSDHGGADDNKKEWLGVAILTQPASPIGPVDWRWRWDWLRVRVPLAEIGTGSVACRPRCVYRRLVPPLGAMKPRASAPVTVHGNCYSVDNDRAAITQMPPQQYAACLSCAARRLDKALHGLPGSGTDLKSRSMRPKKDPRPGLVLVTHQSLRSAWSPHTGQRALL